MVQDFTALPSSITVQAPQMDVSRLHLVDIRRAVDSERNLPFHVCRPDTKVAEFEEESKREVALQYTLRERRYCV
jgi:hypothetical protein